MTNTPLISCLQYFLYFSPHQGIHAITAWSAMHQNDIGMRTLPGVGRDKSRVTAWYLMTQVLLVSFRASPTCPSIRILRCHLYVDVDCTIQSMLVWIISISLGNSRALTCCIAVAGLAIFLYVDQLMHSSISTPFLRKYGPQLWLWPRDDGRCECISWLCSYHETWVRYVRIPHLLIGPCCVHRPLPVIWALRKAL